MQFFNIDYLRYVFKNPSLKHFVIDDRDLLFFIYYKSKSDEPELPDRMKKILKFQLYTLPVRWDS